MIIISFLKFYYLTIQMGKNDKKDTKKAPAAKKAAVAKATKAAKAVKTNAHKRSTKVRTSVTFRRPKTLVKARNPKYLRSSFPARNKLDKYAVIKHPLVSESALKQMEDNNTLTFIVDVRCNKRQIGAAIKSLYDIEAATVRTLIRCV